MSNQQIRRIAMAVCAVILLVAVGVCVREIFSGSIDYDLALSREGDRYVCGDGSGTVELGSTSGDIRLNRAAQ